ncbi:hypothetical protein LNV09_15855 [Paucibacter sp. B2R-40]|uniref:hypothetical protein n=1 Tax=Paucibacter sp. B2R-40 TaxID=2893554 RepID=UPI0021E4855E|nr:hypothetical protein [Paucibacter sp. B2R-40]MCV2355618.1 hypothetical protein [Paucibacter sp. B2R-40]
MSSVFRAKGTCKVSGGDNLEVSASAGVGLEIATGGSIVLLGVSHSGNSTQLKILGDFDIPHISVFTALTTDPAASPRPK